jgi:hypothetical protein
MAGAYSWYSPHLFVLVEEARGLASTRQTCYESRFQSRKTSEDVRIYVVVSQHLPIFFPSKASAKMPSFPPVIQDEISREIFKIGLELELNSHLSRMFDTNIVSRPPCQEPTF